MVNLAEQRCFLQGLALGRALRGVSFHGPWQGAVQMAGISGGRARVGQVLPGTQPMQPGGLVGRACCVGSYTTAAMPAVEE